ncbi:ABC transporter substrate-binding protein [Aeromicrobium piscarium]|nr:ABC transporter substrate-binding protein [Aeromicrobium piscarium]
MRAHRTLKTIAVGAAAMVILAGCGDSGADDDEDFTLDIAITTDLQAFNPLSVTNATDIQVMNTMYLPLMRLKEGGGLEPGLMSSCTYEDGNQRVEWTIDDGYQWSDGEPVTADDVVFTMQTGIASDMYGLWQGNVESVEALDESTVSANLLTPATTACEDSSQVLVVPQHVWGDVVEEQGADQMGTFTLSEKDALWVGNGPYVLAEERKGDRYTFERNEHWPTEHGEVKASSVVYRFFPDANTAQVALTSGEVAAIAPAVSESARRTLEGSGGVELKTVAPGTSYAKLTVNTDRVPEQELRSLLLSFVDPEQVVKSVLLDTGEPLVTPLVSGGLTPDVDEREFSTAEAERIVAETGADAREFRVLCDSGVANFVKILDLMTEKAAEVGITLVNDCQERNSARSASKEGNFDLFINPLGAGYLSPLTFTTISWDPRQADLGVFYGGHYEDPVIQQAADEARASGTSEAGEKAAKTIVERVYEQGYARGIYSPEMAFAVSSDYSGWETANFESFSITNAWSLANVTRAD